MLRKFIVPVAAALLVSACTQAEMAATPPAPPPPPPKTFAVLFATGSAALTPDSMSVIRQAAAEYKPSWAMGMTATGHTDTVGDPASNLALSQRRAAAVKLGLVAAGAPEGEIKAGAVGETQLPVQTPDQVANAQNRSVMIVYGPRDDQGYCRALIRQYREWAGRRETDAATGLAMNQCESGQSPAASIPQLEKVNLDAKLKLPVRP